MKETLQAIWGLLMLGCITAFWLAYQNNKLQNKTRTLLKDIDARILFEYGVEIGRLHDVPASAK